MFWKTYAPLKQLIVCQPDCRVSSLSLPPSLPPSPPPPPLSLSLSHSHSPVSRAGLLYCSHTPVSRAGLRSTAAILPSAEQAYALLQPFSRQQSRPTLLLPLSRQQAYSTAAILPSAEQAYALLLPFPSAEQAYAMSKRARKDVERSERDVSTVYFLFEVPFLFLQVPDVK